MRPVRVLCSLAERTRTLKRGRRALYNLSREDFSEPKPGASRLNCLLFCFELIVREERRSPAHCIGHQKQKVLLRRMPLRFYGASMAADDDTMKSSGRNNSSLSGDLVPLPRKDPEGRLLSCILKALFSQNKAAQSVIKTPK